MKNLLLKGLALCVVALLTFACGKGGEEIDHGTFELSTKLIKTDALGVTQKVTVNAPADWYAVTSENSWISIKPASGKKGATEVTVTIKDNPRTSPRAGQIHFKAGKVEDEIRITQDFGKYFILPCNTYSIDFAGGNILIGGLPANGNYKINIPDDAGWLTAAGNMLRVAYNANSVPRTTTLSIADNANNKNYKVIIIQESSTGQDLFSLQSLTIDGIACLTDSRTVISDFFYSVDMDLKETSRTVKVEYTGTGVEWIQIGESTKKVYSGDMVTIPNFTANNTLKITGHNSNVDRTGTSELVISGLPLVNVLTTGTIVDEPKVDCKISIFDPKGRTEDGDQKNIVFFESQAGIEYRGAGAQRYVKKPYNFKLRDVFGEKREAKILGIRNDNSWILDAMFLDVAHMRTRVNFDLWNTFNRPYYVDEKPKAMSGTRGHLTEVFINGEYFGIFMLTDRIDRKQYQIEQQGGYIYKAKGWSNACRLRGYSTPSNNDHYWSSAEIEQEYPGPDDGAPNFNYMAEFIDFVANSSKKDFDEQFEEWIDMNSVVDAFIFINLIMAYDNIGRNTFWILRDINTSRKMIHGLWDLDGTLGRTWDRWDRSHNNNANPSTGFVYSGFKIYERILDENPANIHQKLLDRWNKLKDNELAPAKFDALVEYYAEQQVASGARDREMDRWNQLDANEQPRWNYMPAYYGNLSNELAYMKQWYRDRHSRMTELFNDKFGE